VRVHIGDAAARTADHLAARAFTVGTNIVFGAGQYAPDTTTGRRILAHELTHVVQHDHGTVQRQQVDSGHGASTTERVRELPSAQEQRKQVHSTSVMARVGELSEGEVAESDKAIAGVRLLTKLEHRNWLLRERDRRERRGMGIAWHAGQAPEYHRVQIEIADGLAALGLPDEAALLDLIHRRLPDRVLAKARQIAMSMLDENEAVARREQERYGKFVCTKDQASLLEADRQLARMDRKQEIARLRAEMEAEAAPLQRRGMGIAVLVRPTYRALSKAEQEQHRADELRGILGIQYPILLSERYHPGMFVAADPMVLHELIQGPTGEILDNIARVREAINDDELKVWNIPNAVAMAQLALGIAREPVLTAAVDARVRSIQRDEQFWAWVKAALAITTTILAGVLLTPAMGALVGAAWSVDSLIGNIAKYRMEKAAEGTSLDPAVADMSLNEPELLWIVVDIVGLGLDLAVITKAMRVAARGLLRNPGPATLGRLEQAAAEAGVPQQARSMLRSTVAQRFGVAAEEAVELAPQTRRVAVSDASRTLLAQYERLANQRIRAVLTDVMRQGSTPNRRELADLLRRFRDLMGQVGEAPLTPAQRSTAEAILRRARKLSQRDWGNVRNAIWARLSKDPELSALAERMVAKGDAQIGRLGQLKIRTAHDAGGVKFQALEPDHLVRRTDNPWRYSDPTNLNLTDSAQNQQFLETLRQQGSIWATDDIERFVVGNGLSSQSTTRLPGM
jgi:hypothetical protein